MTGGPQRDRWQTLTRQAVASTVLVAIPAKNEAETIQACLRSVAAAMHCAADEGLIKQGLIAVCAHRSTDATYSLARSVLRNSPATIDTLVVSCENQATVGAVRSHLIDSALNHWGLPADTRDDWIFSTDADTTVPVDWIGGMLDPAWAQLADMVTGMVDVNDWTADDLAKQRYAAIISAGLTPRGHRHVYAANLAVRLTTYLDAGGFPSLQHGEEHGLLHAVRSIGGTVVTPRHPRTTTSGRMIGRAEAGLAALLAQLAVSRAETSHVMAAQAKG